MGNNHIIYVIYMYIYIPASENGWHYNAYSENKPSTTFSQKSYILYFHYTNAYIDSSGQQQHGSSQSRKWH
jgi:hypothetical protein